MNNIAMNHFYTFSQRTASFFKEGIIPAFTERQQKVAVFAALLFASLTTCYAIYQLCNRQDSPFKSDNEELHPNLSGFISENILYAREMIKDSDYKELEEKIHSIGLHASPIIKSEPENPTQITKEEQVDSSQQLSTDLVLRDLQHQIKSNVVQEISLYANPKTLYLEEISDIPPEKFLVIKNHAYHIDELVSHILSKHGVFIDPYRKCMFDDDDIKKILSFKEAQSITELNKNKDCSFQKIPKSAGDQLKNLAMIMSKDYDLQGGYQASKEGVEHFQTYFSSLSFEEQEALESAIITYKDTSIRPAIIVRSTFKEVFSALATGEFCNHVAAFYFWILGMKISPSSEPMPNEIAFTSRYWDNLLVE